MKSRTGRGGFEDLMREKEAALSFTVAEIRAVMDKHYPSTSYGTDDVLCVCGPATVASPNCRYCRAPVDQENYRATRHRSNCSRPSGFPQVGVTSLRYNEFTVDHLIEKLKENREYTRA